MSKHTPLAVLALAFLGAVATTGQQGSTKAPQKQPAKANLIIRKAVYGDLPDGMTVDVTAKVRTMVKNGTLTVKASDDNFGDPYNGTMNLTIVKAIYRSVGGEVDITDNVRANVDGNRLVGSMKDEGTVVSPQPSVTVYYRYGEGETLSMVEHAGGSIEIKPPTKLRVAYTLNGVNGWKTVDLDQTLEVKGK